MKDCGLPPPITIALATYNGAAFLATQLASIASQTYPHWRLLISDDGSSDATMQIASDFLASFPKDRGQIIPGPRAGSTRNFLHLTRQVSDGWLAYCDQDDKWLPDKLERAAAFLTEQSGPAIYAARTTICDADLNILAPAPAFTRPLTFTNALIQACLPGNTIVANQAALRLLQQGAPAAEAAGIVSHDWWAYQLLSGAGAAIMRDRAQVLLYRQHPENLMGRNDTARAKAARVSQLFDGTFSAWLDANQAALEPVADLLTAENRKLLVDFKNARHKPGLMTAAALWRRGFYRQSRAGTCAIMAAAATGRLSSR